MKQDNQLLLCIVCCQQFDQKERLPKILCKNQHMACSQCVELFWKNLNKQKDTYNCPLCGQPIIYKDITPFRYFKDIIQQKQILRIDKSMLRKEKNCLENGKKEIKEKFQLVKNIETLLHQNYQMKCFMENIMRHQNQEFIKKIEQKQSENKELKETVRRLETIIVQKAREANQQEMEDKKKRLQFQQEINNKIETLTNLNNKQQRNYKDLMAFIGYPLQNKEKNDKSQNKINFNQIENKKENNIDKQNPTKLVNFYQLIAKMRQLNQQNSFLQKKMQQKQYQLRLQKQIVLKAKKQYQQKQRKMDEQRIRVENSKRQMKQKQQKINCQKEAILKTKKQIDLKYEKMLEQNEIFQINKQQMMQKQKKIGRQMQKYLKFKKQLQQKQRKILEQTEKNQKNQKQVYQKINYEKKLIQKDKKQIQQQYKILREQKLSIQKMNSNNNSLKQKQKLLPQKAKQDKLKKTEYLINQKQEQDITDSFSRRMSYNLKSSPSLQFLENQNKSSFTSKKYPYIQPSLPGAIKTERQNINMFKKDRKSMHFVNQPNQNKLNSSMIQFTTCQEQKIQQLMEKIDRKYYAKIMLRKLTKGQIYKFIDNNIHLSEDQILQKFKSQMLNQ